MMQNNIVDFRKKKTLLSFFKLKALKRLIIYYSYNSFYLFPIFILIIFHSCIKKYEPEFKENATEKWVIEGSITNIAGWQEIRISKTSNYQSAAFIPIENCQVKIIDDQNQKFDLEYTEDGIYRVWMDAEFLVAGRSYYAHVISPDGKEFQSEPDILPESTSFKEAYFEIEDKPTNTPDVFERGLQFFVNLDASLESNEYFRWRITETWETRSAYPIEFWYDGEVHQESPPDSSKYYCWTTREYPEIFTLSTTNLGQNIVNDIPIQFVTSKSDKLVFLYSYLIEQIALSQKAFDYWEDLKVNVSVGEGLYASQPMAVQGNFKNINQSDESVLGFFSAIHISSHRYFINSIDGLDLEYTNMCSPSVLRKGLIEIKPWEYPAYLQSDNGDWVPVLLNDECVDCTIRGGSPTKPDFWP